MKPLKIGIVEDDLLIAESIAVTLQQIGYQPTKPVRTYADALRMIETETPDLLLVDIILEGEKDGIDLAATVNKNYGTPFIFLTANSDAATVNRAKEVKPYAYLVKPFNENDLFSSIEIAFSNFYSANKNKTENAPLSKLGNVIFVKEGETFHKIEINDIHYVESNNVYLNIYTAKRHYLVRVKLDDFLDKYSIGNFVRVHRSFAINPKHLESINTASVHVSGKEIPMHNNYKQQILDSIETLK